MVFGDNNKICQKSLLHKYYSFYSQLGKCKLPMYVLLDENLVSFGDSDKRFRGFKEAKPELNPCKINLYIRNLERPIKNFIK